MLNAIGRELPEHVVGKPTARVLRFSVEARNGSSMARPLTTITVTPTIALTYSGLHGKDSTEAINTTRKRDDYLVILDFRA